MAYSWRIKEKPKAVDHSESLQTAVSSTNVSERLAASGSGPSVLEREYLDRIQTEMKGSRAPALVSPEGNQNTCAITHGVPQGHAHNEGWVGLET